MVVLDVKGVGFGLFVNAEDYGRLSTNDNVKLYVYEHIREQAHDLYGFTDKETLSLFKKLLDVNGVGPKMALNMLSIGNVSQLKQAIASGDVKFIQQTNGVGKKVAERVVIELKDKVGLGDGLASNDIFVSEASVSNDEATQALVSLGYSVQDAANALNGIDKNLSTEERIKKALMNK
jgi:Holliday junction DNA helicase RuvA